jgi:hypothetical protein
LRAPAIRAFLAVHAFLAFLAVRAFLAFLAMVGAAGLTAAGCGGGSKPPAGCFEGDMSAGPELALVHRTPDGMLAPIADGNELALVVPPQGGEVLLIGVRARNVDGCPLTLSTALVDPGSGVVAAFERRPVTLKLATDGWLEPERPSSLANFSNLPACPIAGLARAVDDSQPWRLDIQVDDAAGHHGEVAATITATCALSADPAGCSCQCAAGYVLGSACP